MGRALNVIGVPTGAATFTAALEGLTALDQQILRKNPGLPSLYEAGVSYTARSTTKWRNVLDCIESKDGDCEALAPWRAAELRESGQDPGAHVLVYPSGTAKFHAVVLKSDGTIEDPSVLLGMKAPPNLVDNYNWWNREVAPRIVDEQPRPSAEIDVLGFDDENVACVGVLPDHAGGIDVVTFDVIKTPEGFRGQFRFPFLDGRALYGLSSTSANEGEAERKASAVLGFCGSIWDDLEALAPGPQSLAVLHLAKNQHVQNLAKAAYGKAKSVVRPGSSSSSSGGGSGRPSSADMDAAAARAADRAAAAASLDTPDADLIAPSPFDDQQQLADVDTFHRTPPGGFDAELAPDLAGADVETYEDAVIGWINASLIAGSRPSRPARSSTPTRAARTSTPARSTSSSSAATPGYHVAPTPAQAAAATAPPVSAAFAGYSPAFSSPPPAYSPGGAGTRAAAGGGRGGAAGARGGAGGGRGAGGAAGGRGGAAGARGGQPQAGQGPSSLGRQAGGQFPPGDPRNQQQGRFPPGDPRDPRNQQQQQQQQQGGGGGGDSGGGGTGAPQAVQTPEDIDAFFAMGPGGRMGDDAFYQAAQLAQQVDQFEGNAPADGYAGPDYAGDAAADAFAAEGQGMSDQQFADASAFAQQAYQQEAGG